MPKRKLPIVYVALHRYRIGYELATSGWEAYEAVVDAPTREMAEEKVRKFVDTLEIPPGMQGEPEMVNAQNETLGVDTIEIVHVEKLTPGGGRSGAPLGSQGPFSKRVVGPEGYPIGPGRGWHGEPGRHRKAAKKGRRK